MYKFCVILIKSGLLSYLHIDNNTISISNGLSLRLILMLILALILELI